MLLLSLALLFAEKPAPAAVPLFNGKDLAGWKVFIDPRDKSGATAETIWTVKDGELRCTGKPTAWIGTEKEYGDYVLELEWKWPGKPGNSGVLIHATGPDKIWSKSLEAQMKAGQAGEIWTVDGFKCDTDKARVNPKNARQTYRVKTDKPLEKAAGEWNTYRITCRGDAVTIQVNGVEVNTATKAEATKGRIMLQSEGAPIVFRNVRITSLK